MTSQHTATEPRPQPVIDAAKLGGLTGAATTAVGGTVILVISGQAGDVGALGLSVGAAVTAVAALIAYVAPVINARKASADVTPLEDPRDDAGRQLVPADTYGEHAAP